MPFEFTLQRYVQGWAEALGLARRPVLFLPLFVIALVKVAVLLLMYYFWHPSIAGFMVPTLKSLAGERMLHFPDHVWALPDAFRVVEIGVMVVIGIVMVGWSVFMMIDTMEGKRYGVARYAGEVIVSIPSLLLIGLCFAACVLGIPLMLEWVGKGMAERPKLQLLILTSALGVSFYAEVFLAYSLYYLKTQRGSGFSAVRGSVRRARRDFALTAGVVLTVFVFEKPLEYLASEAVSLVANLHEERVLVYLLAKVLLGVLTTFFLFGAVTSIAMAERRM
jgi:hypothetical protein